MRPESYFLQKAIIAWLRKKAYANKKFHRFIHGRKFTSQTDHWVLLTIFELKTVIPTHTGNRLQRWGIILLNYNFKMESQSSKELGHAEGLSRFIPKFSEPLVETVVAALRDEKELSVLCNTIYDSRKYKKSS